MFKPKRRHIVSGAALFVVAGLALYLTGCVHYSGGTWMVKSAPLPEGWPELTPIGEVQIKQYPVYRAAVIDDTNVDPTQRGMFMPLFDHISDNDIAMTTPVEMGYTIANDGPPRMQSMAFLYRTTDMGTTGEDGDVVVRDFDSQTMASIGVRGGYTDEHFQENITILNTWLAERQDQYRVTGSPRYLGYNGPFTLPFMRYGEVQVPVEPLNDSHADVSSADG